MPQHPAPASGRTIILPPILDRRAAADLLPMLRDAVAAGHLAIDGSRVERIGQAGLQLVVTAHRTAPAAVTLRDPSAALDDAVALAGFEDLSPFAEAGRDA